MHASVSRRSTLGLWILTLGLLGFLPTLSAADAGSGAGDKAKKEEGKIKAYDEVITEKARTQAGLFRVHQIDDKLFYEIVPGVLDRDLLWVTQIAAT
ncbi:MAG: DUF5118 domain-containing protein, partial [Verrucomicrobiae bacterium]|nr:DUF5118 domain-containing protein [Verrucomicrobiae bacterium]